MAKKKKMITCGLNSLVMSFNEDCGLFFVVTTQHYNDVDSFYLKIRLIL